MLLLLAALGMLGVPENPETPEVPEALEAAASMPAIVDGPPLTGPFEIRLARPLKPGQRFVLTATASIERTRTALADDGPQRLVDEQTLVAFDSIMQVGKVDTLGRPTAVTHTVGECTLMRGGRLTRLLTRGDTLIARRRGRTTMFFVRGMTFDEAQTQALAAVAGLNGYDESADRLFGSRQSRRVGERWPADAAALAEECNIMTGTRVPVESVAGSVTLEEVKPHDGVLCQLVRAEVSFGGVAPGPGELSPKTVLQGNGTRCRSYYVVPVDVALPPLEEQTVLETRTVLTDYSGVRPLDLEISTRTKATRAYQNLAGYVAVHADRP